MTFTKKIILMMIILFLVFGMFTDLSACDTWVALKDATRKGIVILGKNSDRTLFDCQPLMFYPRAKWQPGSMIDLGRISIPQVNETYATMGSSPYWCWGYEEGINEYGVAVGNEGVHTKVLAEEIAADQKGKAKLGPTGMDLIRLALERSKTAAQALDVLTSLIETYGQYGSGTPTIGSPGAYHNSYIIADAAGAWILETAGKHWAAKKLDKGAASISNTLSIDTTWDKASANLVKYAVDKRWWPEEKQDSFSFRRAYTDGSGKNRTRFRSAVVRSGRSLELLEEKKGRIDNEWMKRIARDRETTPAIDLDQTASSCTAELPGNKEQLPVFRWCPAVPSTGCYVPFFVHGSKLPEIVSAAGTYGKVVQPPAKVKQDSFSPRSYWWLFRDLTDRVNLDREKRLPIVRKEFDALEQAFDAAVPAIVKQAVALRKAGKNEKAAQVLNEFSADCVAKVVKKVNQLRERFKEAAVEVPEAYKPYVGIYIANFGSFKDAKFKVRMLNDRLAVDIPGRTTMELKAPDEEDLWYYKSSPAAAFSFDRDEQGNVAAMNLYQINALVKKPVEKGKAEGKPQEGVEEKYRPYVGDYINFSSTVVFKAFVKDGKLMLEYRGKDIIELKPPDEIGRWYFAQDPNAAVTFGKDDKGNVNTLKLFQKIRIPREKSR